MAALALVAMLMVTVIPTPVVAQDDTPWPTKGWLTSTPEEQGVDSATLLALLDEIESQGITLDNLLVIRHGYLVMDAYFWPFERGMRHNLYSATKSFTSALVGVAMQQGYIQSVDQPVLELLPGYISADPGWSDITLRDALTMSTGADCTIDPLWHETDDWTQDILDLAIVRPQAWQYCSYSPQLLSSIVGRVTGMPSQDFARENLLEPLGITDHDWPTDPQGNVLGPTDLAMTPYDMAKLGYLSLHDGRWADQQLVPAEYVRESACMVDDTAYCRRGSTAPYGYQWWVMKSNLPTYSAIGHVAQQIMVVPERDLVIVITAHGLQYNASDAVGLLVANKVAEAAVSELPLPADPALQAQLEARISMLAQQPMNGESAPVPDAVRTLSGQRLELATLLDFGSDYWYFLYPRWNPTELPATRHQVRAIRLTAGDDTGEATLNLEFADGYTVDLAVGMDGVYRTTESRFGTLAAKGHWGLGGGKVTFLINDVHVVGEGRANSFLIYLSDAPIRVVSYCVTASWAPALRAEVQE